MMELTEKAAIIHYHRHRMEAHERGTVESLGFRSAASQQKRFEALTAVGDLNGCSVLDVGCGYGDLKAFLDHRFHGFSYVGIDLMPEFVMEARSLYGQRPNCYFCVADLAAQELPSADYVFASGVLSYRCADEAFYFAMIEKMYRAAGKALAFNMLDGRCFPEHPLLKAHSPDEVLSFCRTLSPQAELVSGYLEDDFTVLIYKN